MKHSRKLRISAATLAAAAIPMVVGAAAATASPSPWETVHEVYDTENPLTIENFCQVEGLTVVASGSIDYRHRTTTQGADGLPYYTEHVTSFVDIFTNKDTGAFVTTVGHYAFKTVSVTDNRDGTLTIVYQYTVSEQTTDDAGQVVTKNTGLYRYVSVVDHNGTPSDPSDDTELESSDLKVTGLETDGWCATFVAALT